MKMPVRNTPHASRSADGTGQGLSAAAEAADDEQLALLESAPIEHTYQEALVDYVQSKLSQAEHIEDRLEHFIDLQQDQLMHLQTERPGFFSRPGAKRDWQTQQVRQQARLQALRARLEVVKEIKEGMGLHAPKIEELATRKLRSEHPGLAADWDAMRESIRIHQSSARLQGKGRRPQGQSQSLQLGRRTSPQ